MSEAEVEEDYDAHEQPRPSWAMPPVYLLRTAVQCPGCGQPTHVHMPGCAAFQHAGDDSPVEEFRFLRYVTGVPAELLDTLKRIAPRLFHDREAGGWPPYRMNHCRCGAGLNDDYLSGGVGAAFTPDTPDGYAAFRLHRLAVDEPIPIECSYILGGREYLEFGRTW